MGKRFLAARFPLEQYSRRWAWLRLHEGKSNPHQMKPYGRESGNFVYRQLFHKKHQTRQGNCTIKRAVKKTARQHARRDLWESVFCDE